MERFASTRRISRSLAVLAIALGLGTHATACGSDARATDTCQRIEYERCTKAPSCPDEFPDFLERYASVDSCKKFYEVQCGRGVSDLVKEPSRAEMAACLETIKGSCQAALTPEKFCPFLTANEPPVTVVDSGAAEAATEAATDAANEGG